MLNTSPVPQIKTSTDKSMIISSSGENNTQEPAVEEFSKVLDREVSETTSKRETNNAATPSKSSDNATLPEDDGTAAAATTAATATTDRPSTNNLIDNLFIDTANTFTTDQLLPLDPARPDPLTATSIPPTALSQLSQGALIPQDNKSATSPALLVNQLLQQKFAQPTSAASNLTYSPNDFWQSMEMAESAAYDKFLPLSSEGSDAMQINTGEAIFPVSHESISAQPFSLSNAAPATSLNTVAPQNIQVDLPVGQPNWDGEFSQKIIWLTSQQNQIAEIHLNPAHLGPVDVMLSITQDQATAQFLSPHLAVREAIEEALPRLREMMAENGIQLGNVMVGADSFQQGNNQQQAFHSAKDGTGMVGTRTETTGQIETTVLPTRHHGMVNTYA
jgi:flagellar hook-length control protein FliK